MSDASSSSAVWPMYGPVPLTRCPDYPRVEQLVRLRCKRVENGNYGREFVKCESRPQSGKILKKCTYFMWMNEYVEKLQFEGKMNGEELMGASELMVSNFRRASPADEQVAANVPADEQVAAELKTLNGKMSQIIDLKKKANLMAGAFYASMIFMGLLFLVFNYGSKQ